MRQLITYFIKYPINGNILMVLILIFGLMGMFSLRKTFFPETESNIIIVEAVYPGAAPEEVEKMIVLKIEDNIDGITGIDEVTSKSSENMGAVTIETDKDFDTQVLLQDVKNAVDRINSFPDAMEPPTIYIKESMSFGISFALSGDVDLKTLKNEAQKVEADLKAMDGISKVDIAGYPDEEIQISFRENDLKKYRLTFDQVNRAVQAENIDITGGKIKTETHDMQIRGRNKVYSADKLQEVVVANVENRLIRLKDVADVKQQWSDVPNRKFFNEKTGVVLTVNNTVHEDVGAIATMVKAYIEDFNENNEVIKADLIRDGSKTVNERIDLLTSNGIIGFILVLIFLSMFLHPSLAGWVAAAIPIAFAGMFILATWYGITLNVISLFGMIIVIGILVDDGIVIAENIYQHYERGKEPIKAAVDGTMEVLPAVFSAIMTTVVAFSLFFLMDGRMGDFFPQMGFVVIGTLIFSLIEGALILPAHIAHSKAVSGEKNNAFSQWIIDSFTKLLNWLRVKTYEPMLRFAMKNPLHVVLITVCLMAITIAGMKSGLIKATVFPDIEGENINVTLKLEPGTSEKVTAKWLDYIEGRINELGDELNAGIGDSANVFVGIEKTIGPGAENGGLNIILMSNEERTEHGIRIKDVTRMMNERVGEIPGAEALSFAVSGPFGRAVSLALYSDDNAELEEATEILKQEMEKLGTLMNIESSNQKGMQEVNLKLKEKAYLLGFTTMEIMNEVRKGFFGLEAQRLQQGIDEVKVWLRYTEEDRSSISDLENMRIRLRNTSYLLSDLVDIEVNRGIVSIEHLNGKRMVKVNADLINPSIDNPLVEVGRLEDNAIPAIQRDFPSIKYSVEGQIKEQSKTGKSMKYVGPIVLILMLTIIVLTFRSFLQMIAVWTMIPFGMIGVGWGHFIHGHQMSMFSYFGMIALVGVMVNDSLVFISAFNSKMKQGMTFKEALFDAGVSRFRPIILTSLTTIAGLAPLIAETSFQAQFLIPMAIAIAYGLIVATLLTLVFLPAMLVIFNKIRYAREWLFTGKLKNAEEREPAVKELEYENMKFD